MSIFGSDNSTILSLEATIGKQSAHFAVDLVLMLINFFYVVIYLLKNRCPFSSFNLDYTVSNRQLKTMLINLLGDEICFSYPKDRQKSQMFFSAKIQTTDIAETL